MDRILGKKEAKRAYSSLLKVYTDPQSLSLDIEGLKITAPPLDGWGVRDWSGVLVVTDRLGRSVAAHGAWSRNVTFEEHKKWCWNFLAHVLLDFNGMYERSRNSVRLVGEARCVVVSPVNER